MGADEPANGHEVTSGQRAVPARRPVRRTRSRPTARADCEAGQRGYLERNARFYDKRFKIDQDARTPGAQGPTYRGRPRVPKGQTYTDDPGDRPLRGHPRVHER